MRELLEACRTVLGMSWRQSRAKTTASIVLIMLQALSLPLSALALAALTDAAIGADARGVVVAGVVLAFLSIGNIVFNHFAHIPHFDLIEANILALDRRLIALSSESVGLEHHERPEYADKLSTVKGELHRVGWSMEALLTGAALAVAMVVTGVLLASLNVVLLLLLPMLAVPPLLAGRRAEAIVQRHREEAAEPTRQALHVFRLSSREQTSKELRLYGLDGEMVRRHAMAWQARTRILWRGEVRAALLRMGGQLIFALGYIGATMLVIYDAVDRRSSVGDVVLTVTLAVQVHQQVAQAVALVQELQASARTLAQFRWLENLVAEKAGAAPDQPVPATLRHGIRLRQLSFRYPGTDRPALSDADCLLPAGAIVAVVGENGAGKTTLVSLLSRFYEATGGRIEVDGVDLRRIPVEDWRRRMSAGFQDFARFEFIARETVGVGDLDRMDDEHEVHAALDRAGAASIVEQLDDGLATQLGKTYTEGTDLSGGQWQKLALGRAMMRPSPLLLILDEPTSALDAEAEHVLFERYAEGARRVAARTGAITLLVSHRFSTVRMADVILVVDEGRITEMGDHETLMRLGGLYAELYTLQAAAYR